MLAAQNHDQVGFERRVIVSEMVDSLLDDLLVYPAISTPKLSGFQQQVAGGAVAMAKISCRSQIIDSISKAFKSPVTYGDRNYDHSTSCLPADLYFASELRDICEQPAFAAGDKAANNTANTGGAAGGGDFLRSVGRELGGEVGKLKTTAYERMQNYIHSHPQTIPGKLVDCPPSQRAAILRRILEDHGISQNYFKGLTACTTSDLDSASQPATEIKVAMPLDAVPDVVSTHNSASSANQFAHVGLRFYSPVIDEEIILKLEFFKAGENDPYANVWRVRRISNLKDVLNTVAQDYLTEVHELIAYSLYGMNNQNIANDMRGVTNRLKAHPAAQKFLNKFGF